MSYQARYTLALLVLLSGCARDFYRRDADSETYQILEEKTEDPSWVIPHLSISPPPESRLYDPASEDFPPLPPDDPGAHAYMHCADGHRGFPCWHADGDALLLEDIGWLDSLERNEEGALVLTPESAVDLALRHSREYQFQLEDLYIRALALTLNRFDFDLQWFGRNSTFFRHFGSGSAPTESNTLTYDSSLGFSRALTTGGQFVVDFANSFVWEFAGPDGTQAFSSVAVNLVQPLLRGAARDVRLEQLTQSERAVLYAARDFARFRKQFYVDLTTGGVLPLLLQLQSIRNQEANVLSLEQNLRIQEARLENREISTFEVDLVFQQYQQGRFGLLQAQTNLETALDRFAITLGLPPSVKIELDDSVLAPFELNDPRLIELQEELERLLAGYRVLDTAPSAARLREGHEGLVELLSRAEGFVDSVRGELDNWKNQYAHREQQEDPERARREQANQDILSQVLDYLRDEFTQQHKDIQSSMSQLSDDKATESWEKFKELAEVQIDRVAELFVVQTQIRVYLIQLQLLEFEQDAALEFARENRLDLMNQRARVVDAWRGIHVAADGLESDLDVVFDADIASEAGTNRPFDLASSASSYRVGLALDGPLNRKAERNIYRRSLINYQRGRRAFMALDDQIQQAIRRDLRQLETSRLNFEISRQSLLVAARQVESAHIKLKLEGVASGSSTTRDILDALNSLLQAKNALIGVWVSYEQNRMQLLLDLEALQLDERGVPTNEFNNPSSQIPGGPAGEQAGDLGGS